MALSNGIIVNPVTREDIIKSGPRWESNPGPKEPSSRTIYRQVSFEMTNSFNKIRRESEEKYSPYYK